MAAPGVDVDAEGKQQLHHFDAARLRRPVNRHVAIDGVMGPRIGAGGKQGFRDRHVPVGGGDGERRSSLRIAGIEVSAAIDQKLRHFGMTADMRQDGADASARDPLPPPDQRRRRSAFRQSRSARSPRQGAAACPIGRAHSRPRHARSAPERAPRRRHSRRLADRPAERPGRAGIRRPRHCLRIRAYCSGRTPELSVASMSAPSPIKSSIAFRWP